MNDKEKNRLEWRERVNQFRASGESMTKWCNENNLKVYQLQYWLKKYKDEDSVESNSSTKWVTVSLDESISKNNLDIQEKQNIQKTKVHDNLSITIGKSTIEVKQGFDSNLLLDVVKVLTSLC